MKNSTKLQIFGVSVGSVWLTACVSIGVTLAILDSSCVKGLTNNSGYTKCEGGFMTRYTLDITGGTVVTSRDPNKQCGKPSSQTTSNSMAAVPSAGTSGKLNKNSLSASVNSGASVAIPRILDLPFPVLVPTGQQPSSLACDPAFSPDVLVVNHEGFSISRYSTCPLRNLTTIQVGSRPLEVAVTPDGTTALVSNFDGTVSFVDLATNRTASTLSFTQTTNPSGVAISPDGTRAYITSFNPQNAALVVVDVAASKEITRISLPAYPQSAYITPDGSQVYVTFPVGQGVYVIDTLTNTVAYTIPANQVYAMAFNPTGTIAYIASSDKNPGSLLLLDTATNKILKSYDVGVNPNEVAVSGTGDLVLVNNYGSDFISILNTKSGQIRTGPAVAGGQGLAITE